MTDDLWHTKDCPGNDPEPGREYNAFIEVAVLRVRPVGTLVMRCAQCGRTCIADVFPGNPYARLTSRGKTWWVRQRTLPWAQGEAKIYPSLSRR